MNGFDQTVGALKNNGNTGLNAMITNRSASVSTLTVSQAVVTVYGGTIHGPIARQRRRWPSDSRLSDALLRRDDRARRHAGAGDE